MSSLAAEPAGTPVVLYGRPGCHLCDEAREMLFALAREGATIDLREVDIEADDALLRAYLERIPVIEIGGAIASELEPDRSAIARALGTFGR